MAFDAKKHIIELKGKKYLETKWRIAWFRDEHPHGCIETEILPFDALTVKATVRNAEGFLLATGLGSANDKGNAVWSGRSLEKAETAAIGRALGHAGYGTQFLDSDADYLADSPTAPRNTSGGNRPQATPSASQQPAQGQQQPPANIRDAADQFGATYTKRQPIGRDDGYTLDMDAAYEATKQHFGHRKHFDALVNRLAEAGEPLVSTAQVIDAINANRDKEGKADAGWYTVGATVKQLSDSLRRDYGMNIEGALAYLDARLDQYGGPQSVLDAIRDKRHFESIAQV